MSDSIVVIFHFRGAPLRVKKKPKAIVFSSPVPTYYSCVYYYRVAAAVAVFAYNIRKFCSKTRPKNISRKSALSRRQLRVIYYIIVNHKKRIARKKMRKRKKTAKVRKTVI